MAFPSIELIATADWSVPIGMEDRTIRVWGFSLDGSRVFRGAVPFLVERR